MKEYSFTTLIQDQSEKCKKPYEGEKDFLIRENGGEIRYKRNEGKR